MVLTSATSATSTVPPMDPSSVEEHRGIGSHSTVYNGRRMTRDRRPWPPRRRARGLPRALRVGRMIAIRRAGTSSHREGQGERGRGPGRAREGEGLSLQPVRLSTVHRISGHTTWQVSTYSRSEKNSLFFHPRGPAPARINQQRQFVPDGSPNREFHHEINSIRISPTQQQSGLLAPLGSLAGAVPLRHHHTCLPRGRGHPPRRSHGDSRQRLANHRGAPRRARRQELRPSLVCGLLASVSARRTP